MAGQAGFVSDRFGRAVAFEGKPDSDRIDGLEASLELSPPPPMTYPCRPMTRPAGFRIVPLVGVRRDGTLDDPAEPLMRRHNMDALADDASLPVIVPRSNKVLVPTSPERARRLRRHLIAALRALRTMKRSEHADPPPPPEPAGFVARVAQAACTLCKGWCCKGGGDHAYLDEQTMARVRRDRPEQEARAILKLYIENVPRDGYAGSCLFHGAQGCTLTRSLRSDVCNSYFCAGLASYLSGDDTASPVVVIAGEGAAMRTSSILVP